jgi:hypothetical protein
LEQVRKLSDILQRELGKTEIEPDELDAKARQLLVAISTRAFPQERSAEITAAMNRLLELTEPKR